MKYARVINGTVVALCTVQFADYTVEVADGVQLGMSPTATDAEIAAAQLAKQQESEAKAAAEVARLAKRPKRSEINAVLAGIQAATTIATLRAETLKLAGMMSNVLDLQEVEVDEDV